MERKLKIGLYGFNGHQIDGKLKNNPFGTVVAVCTGDAGKRKINSLSDDVTYYPTLDEMLLDNEIEMVSLCSPVRADQEQDAIKCLKAGKHVYAEKPAALSEKSLDLILQIAKENGVEFHEMADTVFYEPYHSARKIIASGKLGKVVQVYAQKSYPSRFDSRPSDEITDGGLIRWVGIHAVRFVEHLTALKVDKISSYETQLGNNKEKGGIFTAASISMTLDNGGVASICLNYLKPAGFKGWGNECVRVFGEKGFLEITDGGKHTHVYTDIDEGEIDLSSSDCKDYLDLIMQHLLFNSELSLTTEDEFHPLRVVIRAKDTAVCTREE